MKTQILSSLKTIFKLSMLALVMMAVSCSQETDADPSLNDTENLISHTAKGKKARPIKASLFNFEDPKEDPLLRTSCEGQFTLTRNIINGNMSHLGKLQPGESDNSGRIDEETGQQYGVPLSGSFGVVISCKINDNLSDPENPSYTLTTEYLVNYVAANGDEFHTLENVTIIFDLTNPEFSTGTFEGNIEILDGSGRFEGATGNMEFVDAVFGPEGSTWKLVGEITY